MNFDGNRLNIVHIEIERNIFGHTRDIIQHTSVFLYYIDLFNLIICLKALSIELIVFFSIEQR